MVETWKCNLIGGQNRNQRVQGLSGLYMDNGKMGSVPFSPSRKFSGISGTSIACIERTHESHGCFFPGAVFMRHFAPHTLHIAYSLLVASRPWITPRYYIPLLTTYIPLFPLTPSKIHLCLTFGSASGANGNSRKQKARPSRKCGP